MPRRRIYSGDTTILTSALDWRRVVGNSHTLSSLLPGKEEAGKKTNERKQNRCVTHNFGHCQSYSILKHSVSETGFCLRRQRLVLSIGPTCVGPQEGDRNQAPKRCVLNKLDNVQNCDSNVNVPSSQTHRSEK
jgi:hypothetical protein